MDDIGIIDVLGPILQPLIEKYPKFEIEWSSEYPAIKFFTTVGEKKRVLYPVFVEHESHYVIVLYVVPNLNGDPKRPYHSKTRKKFDIRDPDLDVAQEVYNTVEKILEEWYNWTLLEIMSKENTSDQV